MSTVKKVSKSNQNSKIPMEEKKNGRVLPGPQTIVNSSSIHPQLIGDVPRAYTLRRLRGGRKHVVHKSRLHAFLKRKPWTEMDRKLDIGRSKVDEWEGGSVRVSNKHFYTDPGDVELAGSFVDLNTVYRFRLGGHSTLSATLGVVNAFFACDPSASGLNFPEWSTLSALFSEFRLVSLKLQFLRNQNTAVTAAAPFMIAGNLGTAIVPGSYAALADNADAKMWGGYADTSAQGYTHVLQGTNLNWSEVTTPTTTPYAGAPGSIQVYSNTTFAGTSANDAYHVLVSAIYDFRSRV